MCAKGLNIFFTGPFQYLFFIVGKGAVTFLVDLVKDLIHFLLGYQGGLNEWLYPGLIKQLSLNDLALLGLVGIKEIIDPIKEIVHPGAPVFAALHHAHKQEAHGSTS